MRRKFTPLDAATRAKNYQKRRRNYHESFVDPDTRFLAIVLQQRIDYCAKLLGVEAAELAAWLDARDRAASESARTAEGCPFGDEPGYVDDPDPEPILKAKAAGAC
jgi:hypothetical protein